MSPLARSRGAFLDGGAYLWSDGTPRFDREAESPGVS